MILYIQPVTNLGALAVYGERFALQRIEDHQRNEFFREVVGAVVVGAVGD